MKRKTSAKRISERSKKKATRKKIIAVPGSPGERTAKKEKVKKVKPKNAEKKRAKAEVKVDIKTAVRAEKKSARTSSKEKEKAKTKKASEKPTTERKKKVSLTTSKKVAAGKKVAAKPFKKAKVEVKQKTAKIAEKAVKKYARETAKELEAKKFTKIPKKKVKGKRKEKDHPGKGEKSQQIPSEILPSEYGENDITAMPVDPHKLFVFWEVREDTMEMYEGDLTIRVCEGAGADFNRIDESSYFDIAVSERIGQRYIDVSPAREFIADIGITCEGTFIVIARSHKVSTPRAGSAAEDALPQDLDETVRRLGY